MRIGGFIPCSLGDFPGRIAAVVFTQGCNWRCPWCHNPALVHPHLFAPSLPETEIFARLERLRGKIDGVVVSGGEPTLQADLPNFLQRCRGLGLALKLDTNGSAPAVVAKLIAENLVDFVALDLKAAWNNYPAAIGTRVDTSSIEATIGLLRNSKIEHLLRTTRWPGFSQHDESSVFSVALGSPHVWQQYRPPPTSHKMELSG